MHTRLLVIATGCMTFLLMLVMETSKELFFRAQLNPWQSHWITIIFTSFIAMVACLLLFRYLDNTQQQRQLITIREEKLRTLEQVMVKVNHHVNNLANNLQLIELENKGGKISELTLQELREAILETSREMRRLSAATDVENPDLYSITFPATNKGGKAITKHYDKLRPAPQRAG